MKNDIDPTKAFVAEDGYEYEDLADYLVGKKVDCRRNGLVTNAKGWWPEGCDALNGQIWALYRYYNRDGDTYGAGVAGLDYYRRVPPGTERFAPEGTRSPSPGETSPDPVHAAA